MVMFMKATGLTVKNLVMEFINGPMGMYMKAAGLRTKNLETDYKSGMMEVSMRGGIRKV